MVKLSMPIYIRKSLTKYQHAIPKNPQHQPYKSTPIQYGSKVQYVIEPDTSVPLTKDKTKHVQDIFGTLLYYGQSVDPTIVTALCANAYRQAKCTELVFNTCHQLLEYISTHPNGTIQNCEGDMILALKTDAYHFYEHGGKSWAAAYMFLTKKNQPEFHNSALLIFSGKIKHVMSSASEANIGSLYYFRKSANPLRTNLE